MHEVTNDINLIILLYLNAKNMGKNHANKMYSLYYIALFFINFVPLKRQNLILVVPHHIQILHNFQA